MGNLQEVERFVRDIKGPAASILWVLLLSGSSLTKSQLERATGYSDKSVVKGLERLAGYGLVQDNGRAFGWSMAKQLPLPFWELWQGHSGLLTQTERRQEAACPSPGSQVTRLGVGSQDTPTSGKPVVSSSTQTERRQEAACPSPGSQATRLGAGSQDTPTSAVDNSVGNLPPLVVEPGIFPKSSDLNPEFFRVQSNESGIFPSSSQRIRNFSESADLDLIDLIDQSLEDHRSINQSINQLATRRISELRRAGIGGRVLYELARRDIDPDCILAWYWWAMCQTWLSNPSGYIVSVLRDDAVPEGGWLPLVKWWCQLGDGDRHEVMVQATGIADGVREHGPAATADELGWYLRQHEVPQPSDGRALSALIKLVQCAPEALDGVCKQT